MPPQGYRRSPNGLSVSSTRPVNTQVARARRKRRWASTWASRGARLPHYLVARLCSRVDEDIRGGGMRELSTPRRVATSCRMQCSYGAAPEGGQRAASPGLSCPPRCAPLGVHRDLYVPLRTPATPTLLRERLRASAISTASGSGAAEGGHGGGSPHLERACGVCGAALAHLAAFFKVGLCQGPSGRRGASTNSMAEKH